MTYVAQLTITANSAIDTAAICYRKARRDCYRIHGLLTHPRTVQAAKIAVWCLYLGAVVAYALGQSARILVDAGAKAIQQWAEAEVAACLPTDHIPDAGKMVEADPFAPTVNPHYPAMAATITAPVAVAVVKVEAPKPVTSAELRRQCQAAGIRWRNAHGQGRHLSKAEMISALG
jgi:hypothetical protein